MTGLAPFAPPPATDAGRRNMLLLIHLRWMAVGGQLITIAVVHDFMDIRLPLQPLLVVPALLTLVNAVSLFLLRRRLAVTNAELTAALLLDVAALTRQLHFSGGLANPFASLFLLQVVIGAILLTPRSSVAIVGVTWLALLLLSVHSEPMQLPDRYRDDPLGLYIQGSVVSFALVAVLLLGFVIRITRNLRERDTALATIRQRAAEEDHIVRMGLLASGAAHELGTPLSSLSVLIGDWQRMSQLATNDDLQEDLRDMDQAVQRCKTIVSGILMSAGEARGVAPRITSVRDFLNEMVRDWQSARRPGVIRFEDQFGDDVAIVADQALRQVISNVVDNAAEVSPDWVSIRALREGDALVLKIADRGAGFSDETLAFFGQPYRSTKGKPGGGLGLFLLVNVTRKLGGEAQAINRPEGGALVRISLPIDALAYRKEVRQ